MNSNNLAIPGSCYSQAFSPLLYVDEAICQDLLPRLYRNDALVLPMEDPGKFAMGKAGLHVDFEAISEVRKNQTTTIIVEATQKSPVLWLGDDDDEEDEYDGPPEEDWEFWEEDRGGGEFARRLTQELVMMKPHLPCVKTVKFIFWFQEEGWAAHENHWSEYLSSLTQQWEGITIDLQFNLFDFCDQDAGDGGSNWIQVWDKAYRSSRDVKFSAIDLKRKDYDAGNFMGAEFNPPAWHMGHEINMADPSPERDSILFTGRRVECRPLFVDP